VGRRKCIKKKKNPTKSITRVPSTNFLIVLFVFDFVWKDELARKVTEDER